MMLQYTQKFVNELTHEELLGIFNSETQYPLTSQFVELVASRVIGEKNSRDEPTQLLTSLLGLALGAPGGNTDLVRTVLKYAIQLGDKDLEEAAYRCFQGDIHLFLKADYSSISINEALWFMWNWASTTGTPWTNEQRDLLIDAINSSEQSRSSTNFKTVRDFMRSTCPELYEDYQENFQK